MSKHEICRTCLRPQAENLRFRRLDIQLEASDSEPDTNTTLLECLLYCTKLKNDETLSVVICENCCMALQTTYNFIRNALMAEEVWKKKLEKAGQESIAQVVIGIETSSKVKPKYRYKCKLCGIPLSSKRELKQHVKIHMSDLTYDCTVCAFHTSRRQDLLEHYKADHSIEPTADQLKPNPKKPDQKDQSKKNIENLSKTQEEFLNNTTANSNNQLSETLTTEDLNESANISMNPQYLVLADGSLQALSDSNVLIEYIDPETNVFNTNVVQIRQQEEVPQPQQVLTKVQLNNAIVEELGEMLILPQRKEQLQQTAERSPVAQTEEEEEAFKEPECKKALVTCKICQGNFHSLDELKTHMLNHKDIPQFFCDQCTFYTFYKIDLKQHYSAKHKIQALPKQLQARNAAAVAAASHIDFKCNLCDHKTLYKDNLRRHYVRKHDIPSSEVNIHMLPINGQVAKAKQKPGKCKVVITSTIKLNGHATMPPPPPPLPAPQVQEQQSTINEEKTEDDNKTAESIDFDFNGDAMFDDSLEENVNSSSLLSSQLMLTSDEEDAIVSKQTVTHKCNVCQKTFSTHYKLENHMFMHRGLAPFHCEMCTNLYHTKIELLRHYTIVHKTEPTREMLQPRGDKVSNMANIDNIILRAGNIPTIMCAKCPFETKDRVALIQHLKLAHNTDNEDFIFSKLAYECPRCERSFAIEIELMQHLQRSHSITSINFTNTNALNSMENTPALANSTTNATELTHNCNFCFEECSSIDELQKHICKSLTSISKT